MEAGGEVDISDFNDSFINDKKGDIKSIFKQQSTGFNEIKINEASKKEAFILRDSVIDTLVPYQKKPKMNLQ
ncbi:hypothetical protein [Vaginisenegalia massiliensis]|uniref:hypothetical protein n=1 Tax=Vaginisenegalia massiliensis TaxID=2058294 RepID=UPI000F51DB14|nr:hypothetical protein [Vaginisenegalia massiliensis]